MRNNIGPLSPTYQVDSRNKGAIPKVPKLGLMSNQFVLELKLFAFQWQ